MPKNVMIHETAFVDDEEAIGEGTMVWHFCHVMKGAKIGKNVVLGQNVFVAGGAVVSDGCRIQNNVSLYGGVKLMENVFCGPSMVFTNVRTPRAHVNRKEEYVETMVGEGASIGANATIVCGITLGAYALIGAGSVITKDVRPHAVMARVPARQIGWACRCGEMLQINGERQAKCHRCGDLYEEAEEGLYLLDSKAKGEDR